MNPSSETEKKGLHELTEKRKHGVEWMCLFWSTANQ
jgi:hypothetical protein